MRRLIAALLALGLLTAGCGADATEARTAGAEQRATAGEIEIAVTPLASGEASARFRVVFDTHTVDLDFDPAAIVTIETPDGTVEPTAWDGTGEGGHHRAGNLRFTTDRPLEEITLKVALDDVLVFDWKEDR